MTQLAAGALFAAYVSYAQIEYDTGREHGTSRERHTIVSKWIEDVYPHYIEPSSRQPSPPQAEKALDDWDGDGGAVFVTGKTEPMHCKVGEARPFYFPYVDGEF